MTMRGTCLIVILLAAVVAPPSWAADGGAGSGKSVVGAAAGARAPAAKKDGAREGQDAAARPACRVCGATCRLTPLCVCEPGTKKKPVVDFEVECERICVARCGGLPWPFGTGKKSSCVGCTAGCEACRGWIRTRRTLHSTKRDEEVPIVKRKVEYVCDACGRGPGCCGAAAPSRSWWPAWLPRWCPPPFW